MRIYEGSPRQDFEEVFRSIGAFLDGHGMRDILLLEVPDGFIVQGLAAAGAVELGLVGDRRRHRQGDAVLPRRGHRQVHGGGREAARHRRGRRGGRRDGRLHEQALRVIGHWIDQQKPKDVFLFEQEGAYVVRLNVGGQAGVHHELAEFTRDDVEGLVAQAPSLRNKPADPAG